MPTAACAGVGNAPDGNPGNGVLGIGLAVVLALGLILLAGAVERGYLTRVWRRSSRLAQGRRYENED
jgi:hypothetical protein